MQPAASLEIPPLAATGHTRESLLHTLTHGVPLPSTEVAVATLHAEEIEPEVIAVLERAGGEELDRPSSRLLFRGLHILGGRRLATGYRPLIAFLRGPQERVDDVLGDAVTDTLSRIIAGMFDGDGEPLLALIMDLSADEYVRDAAMGALTFLAFDGRVDRADVERFLDRFEAERAAPAGDQAWYAWMAAVALLGLDSMSERVGAAFRDGRIPEWVADEADYRKMLTAAIEHPEDGERFAAEHLGYIADVLAELEGFWEGDPAIGSAEPDAASERLPWYPQEPAHNPWRGVGRNDPCPCGSGKKFKKCCLP